MPKTTFLNQTRAIIFYAPILTNFNIFRLIFDLIFALKGLIILFVLFLKDIQVQIT